MPSFLFLCVVHYLPRYNRDNIFIWLLEQNANQNRNKYITGGPGIPCSPEIPTIPFEPYEWKYRMTHMTQDESYDMDCSSTCSTQRFNPSQNTYWLESNLYNFSFGDHHLTTAFPWLSPLKCHLMLFCLFTFNMHDKFGYALLQTGNLSWIW